jgi:hypothetical protein
VSTIDRQRVAAVKAMGALGYTFDGVAWNAPTGVNLEHEADALHRLLILRADNLEGCTEGSEEEGELRMIAGALDAYEAKRWPDGAVPGGKAE